MPVPAAPIAARQIRKPGVFPWVVCGVLGLAAPLAPAALHLPRLISIEILPRARGYAGYLPTAGVPAMRWSAPPAPAALPVPPPAALYAPPESKSAPASVAGGTEASVPAAAGAAAPLTIRGEQKPPPLRPEDFLPFFQQTPEGRPPDSRTGDGLNFQPANSGLPASNAAYHQK